MKAGQVVHPEKHETITCVRSAADGGRFCFELQIAAGGEGPPMHRHDEGVEEVEVISGSVDFLYDDGSVHRLGPGDRLSIPAGQAHTFRVSKTGPLLARGTHGPRFEAAVDQFEGGGAAFTRLCLYLTRVDPGASYMVNPAVRLMMRAVAAVGRLRGIEPHATRGAAR